MHVAALWHYPLYDAVFKGTGGAFGPQGTMTFVSYRGMCLGLTNEHVTREVLMSPELTLLLGLDTHSPVPGRLVFSTTQENPSFPYDLSIFILDEEKLRASGKLPVKLFSGQLAENDTCLAVGFPAHLRTADADVSTHPMYHIVATCRFISPEKLILRDVIPERVEDLGGISGGAIFQLLSESDYEFVGVLHEGRMAGGNAAGSIDEPIIWIVGNPISESILDDIFAKLGREDLGMATTLPTRW